MEMFGCWICITIFFGMNAFRNAFQRPTKDHKRTCQSCYPTIVSSNKFRFCNHVVWNVFTCWKRMAPSTFCRWLGRSLEPMVWQCLVRFAQDLRRAKNVTTNCGVLFWQKNDKRNHQRFQRCINYKQMWYDLIFSNYFQVGCRNFPWPWPIPLNKSRLRWGRGPWRPPHCSRWWLTEARSLRRPDVEEVKSWPKHKKPSKNTGN